MRPGPDDNPIHARVVPECGERIEVALDEAVVPAADRKNGNMNMIQTGSCAERAPERVISGMIERLLIHVTALAGGGEVGAAQRYGTHVAIEIRWRKTVREYVLGHPQEPVPQPHGPSGRIEAVQIVVVTGDRGRNGLEVWIVEKGRLPLHDAEIGSANHADLAVAPGLARNPVERVVAIYGLLRERIEDTFRLIMVVEF